MEIKLFDSELKVMDALWKAGDLSAGQLAKILQEDVNWNRNTTYTVIKKCIEKGAIKRYEPNFMCEALISREQVQKDVTTDLINKMFDSSPEKFFAAFLGTQNFTDEDTKKLKQLVENLK